MDKPLVSILINNYNYGRFLRQAIDSALAQTYRPLEVIVVDDGSADDSRQIIAEYGDKVVAVLKQNGGQASAFNAGYLASRGALICFLDSDDYWAPDKVQTVVDAWRSDPDAVLVYHRVEPEAEGGVGAPWPHELFRGDISELAARWGGWWPYPPTSALAFSRAFLERVMPVPEESFRICADAYLADLAPFLGPVVGLPDSPTRYRLHGANQWNNAARLKESTAAMQTHRKRYETRAEALNAALRRLQIAQQVRLEDHFPYQRLKHRLGEGLSLPALSLLAWRTSVRADLAGRLRRLVGVWVKR